MCSGSEAGSYLRLIDFSPLTSRLESDEEEEEARGNGSSPPNLLSFDHVGSKIARSKT